MLTRDLFAVANLLVIKYLRREISAPYHVTFEWGSKTPYKLINLFGTTDLLLPIHSLCIFYGDPIAIKGRLADGHFCTIRSTILVSVQLISDPLINQINQSNLFISGTWPIERKI